MEFMIDDSENIEQDFSKITSLIGEKSRSIMLWNLLDGRAYTATELAICANISRQSCSNHLLKMVEANLLTVVKQGRHKYFKLANENVARVIESIGYLLPQKNQIKKQITKNEKKGIKYARTCYDHLAGKIAVEITESLMKNEIIIFRPDKYEISEKGKKWFRNLAVNTDELQNVKRKFAFPCLDWSERKFHIGGALGAAILDLFIQKGWVRKSKFSREITLTGIGELELSKILKY